MRTALKLSSERHKQAAFSKVFTLCRNNGYGYMLLKRVAREVCTDEGICAMQIMEGIGFGANVSSTIGAENEARTTEMPNKNDAADDVTVTHAVKNKRKRTRRKCNVCGSRLMTWTNEYAHKACRILAGTNVMDRAAEQPEREEDGETDVSAHLTNVLANSEMATDEDGVSISTNTTPTCSSSTRAASASMLSTSMYPSASHSTSTPAQPTPAQYTSTSTQTAPTKGRFVRPILPEVGVRHRQTMASDPMLPFEYVSTPYVCGVSEEMQRIINGEGIKCSLVHGNKPNSLFRPLKDSTPPLARSMVTFAIHCATCGADVYFNATDHNQFARYSSVRIRTPTTHIR